ncbi:DUF624 domain-containing protein [Cerasibacillus terrae]|uniref:DUF624 domain-containing protein n=1 Tax=Cerasibacillus terrae TaxID=2498845 RepID=A0A5C8NH36_9BACI|nr:DUF624 domain-containing protein [Cerasibacillus terrae]TXL61089.1 DUF624 domain-containing protein [Cerasibacillus terrae]
MTRMEGLFIGVYRIGEWVARLAYINFLWMMCTIIGLGLFGFFPATAASFAVFRKWFLDEDKDFYIGKTYWGYFKENLKTANILGYMLLLIGLFLYFDLRFFQTAISHPIFSLISAVFLVLIFLFFIVLLIIFPIFVHYDFKMKDYLKYSLILIIGHPFHTAKVLLSFIVVYLIYSHIPILFFMFGSSILFGVLMWVSCLAFPKEEITVEKVGQN